MQDKRLKICCVTGHRAIPSDRIDYVTGEIHKQVLAAINDGYIYFISGFAEGTDIIFAEVVCNIKREQGGIFLEAALPYTKKNIQKMCKPC